MSKKRIIIKIDNNGNGEINLPEPVLKLAKQGDIEIIAEYRDFELGSDVDD